MTEPSTRRRPDPQLLQIIADSDSGILATIERDGRPQLSNILYAWDPAEGIARISSTNDRVKTRNLRRDPRASLHVAGAHFWQYAVADGAVTLSAVAAEPGDDACRELLEAASVRYGSLDSDDFFRTMIADKRLMIRLHVDRTYGFWLDRPPGG